MGSEMCIRDSGEDAASRVFGLRLDEAKKIADAARAERAEREAIR